MTTTSSSREGAAPRRHDASKTEWHSSPLAHDNLQNDTQQERGQQCTNENSPAAATIAAFHLTTRTTQRVLRYHPCLATPHLSTICFILDPYCGSYILRKSLTQRHSVPNYDTVRASVAKISKSPSVAEKGFTVAHMHLPPFFHSCLSLIHI